MDNLAALRANISDAHGVVLTEDHFVKALVDEGLEADATYNNAGAIDRATLRLYDIILAGGNLAEGHLSYSVNMDSVRAAKKALEGKIGVVEDKLDGIDTASVW